MDSSRGSSNRDSRDRDRDRDRDRERSKSPRRKERRSRSPVRQGDREGESSRQARERSRSPKSKSRRHSSRSPSRERERDSRRNRSRSRSPPRKSKSSRRRSESQSSSSSSESSSSHRRHRKKKSSKSKEERKAKEEKRQRREEKKERIEARSRRKAGLGKKVEWGKHGILVEADIYNKDQEFRTWLVEEQTLNPETVPKSKMKDQFKIFMELFNTATMPHEKYYDLTAHENRLRAIANGETVTTSTGYDASLDEQAIKNSHRRKVVEQDSFLDRGRLVELAKIQSDRIVMERMHKMGIVPKAGMGVRTEEKDQDMGGGA